MTIEDGEGPSRASRLHVARVAVARVLRSHPEARSLLSEASHRRILAEQSAAVADKAAAAAGAARLRYEELRHLLDPRTRRPLPVRTVLVLLVGAGAGLSVLAWLEVGVLPGRKVTAAAVAAAWIAGAWLAATGGRDGHPGRTASAWAAAAAFAALLAALHAIGAPGRSGLLLGVLWAALSGATAVTAAWLITRTEPLALGLARRRWRRAEVRHAAAARTSVTDAQSAAIARQSWLGLVGGTVAGQGEEQLASDATEVAAEMI